MSLKAKLRSLSNVAAELDELFTADSDADDPLAEWEDMSEGERSWVGTRIERPALSATSRPGKALKGVPRASATENLGAT